MEQVKNQRDELMNLINNIEVKANKAISLGESNASKIQANSSKIESNDFEIDQLKNKVVSLNEALNEIRVELDDMRNRGLRKTLIFKNIPFKKKETWDESKGLLMKEIKAVIPDLEETYIMNKIERAHRWKQTEYTTTPTIIAKFNDWQLTETNKTSFINAKSRIFVSQMYSPVLTKRRNEAMKLRKELKKSNPTIQAYVKFPAKLMVKNDKSKKFSLYAEYQQLVMISYLFFSCRRDEFIVWFASSHSPKFRIKNSNILGTLKFRQPPACGYKNEYIFLFLKQPFITVLFPTFSYCETFRCSNI